MKSKLRWNIEKLKRKFVTLFTILGRFMRLQKACLRCKGKGWIYIAFGKDDVAGDTCPICEEKGSVPMFVRR